jgi:hypothetical protein
MGPPPLVIYQSFPTHSHHRNNSNQGEDATRVHSHAQIGIAISQPMEQCLQVHEQLRSSNNGTYGTFVALEDSASSAVTCRLNGTNEKME